ncbi:hypothetical protein M231_05532 [Tremella mesenterica]|uniref:GIT Spa2 homology (SHD) domain-containing protein n=1 Tax=Tremella mesenterica TaxID=5217 RepID=A0A4Q1BHS3_TREME|nr:hypothetical protein M231_05532 [Tremella mesenterica]
MSTSRSYNFPSSPALTTASSLNYSQYGSGSFGPGARNTATSATSFSRPPVGRNGSSGLRPPNSAPAGPGKGDKADSREVARVHWGALRGYLASWLEKESPTARASAREKLTRLTKLQFQELSTDVYDELMRRLAAEEGSGDVPFLPVREDFHPKRNQARQKLATLPKNRFKDLASDVFFELKRRYPEFEEEAANKYQYDEPPPAPGPVPLRPPFPQNPSQASTRDRDRTETPPPLYKGTNQSQQSLHQRQRSRNASQSSSGSGLHQQRPSIDRGISGGFDRDRDRDRPPAALTGTTSEVVVPNKSRLREEEIEVPYARESRMIDPRDSRSESRSSRGRRPNSRGSLEELAPRATTPRGQRVDQGDVLSPGTDDNREYYDRMSFSSNVTNKSKLLNQNVVGWDEERERKIRAEYELRIAGLDRRLVAAEAERDEAKRAEDRARERQREYEDEVRGLKERAATHASSLRSLQHELDLARDATETARRHSEESGQAAADEINQWRDRCEGLEEELRRLEEEIRRLEDEKAALEGQQGGMGGLVDELNSLSAANEQLVIEREQDAERMEEMEGKVEDYRKKYDAVRIELRNLKATSTMFVSKPLTDDHLPASADGNILDIHVSSFQTSIDSLLSSARSSQPSGVLPSMKAVVEAITDIGEDVKHFEQSPNLDVDVSRLESLKHESTARLSTLMQAARNHAMASGLSPVSLLDAAAGHLSANVVEIIKLLKIKRTDKGELRRSRSSLSIREMVSRPPGQDPRSASSANGNFDREYGISQKEELNHQQPAVMVRRPSEIPNILDGRTTPSVSSTPGRNTPSIASTSRPTPSVVPAALNRLNGPGGSPSKGPSAFRSNSFQSASSQGRQSDAFDLERKASMASDRTIPKPLVESRSGKEDGQRSGGTDIRNGGMRELAGSRNDFAYGQTSSPITAESTVGPSTAYGGQNDYAFARDGEGDGSLDDGQEWEDLKPYLNTQSSLLVNSIQNLLAAIRTGSATPALNEHLSEVIAIASSIVAVSTNSLPNSLRQEGDQLLSELVNNTNKLSEAQETAKRGIFEKEIRQGIASASFGVAKALKALMKLGSE